MKRLVAQELKKYLPISEEEIVKILASPPQKELGDFSVPCFIFSKEMKKSPNDIALEFSKKIKSELFETVEASGPYLNIFIERKYLAKSTINQILTKKSKYGSKKIKEKIVLEFPSPNTNKPLHIGHARNIILGQSLARMFSFQGATVKIVNLNNDRGVHICKSMLAYKKFGNNIDPKKARIKSDHIVGDFYVKFAQEAEKNPELEKEAQGLLQKWEAGDKETVLLWRKMNSWALQGFKETYKKFDLKFTKEYMESQIYKSGKEIILEGLEKKIFSKKEDGSIFIDLKNEGLGEKILIRADGTSIYITQDLALILKKEKDFSPDKSIIITAQEQNHHFKVLFKVLSMLKPEIKNQIHYSYGMVNLESGRMKSREGKVIDADDLIKDLSDLALSEIEKRYPKLSQKDKNTRAEKIALASLRYNFLKIDHMKDTVFRPEDSLSFEGNTGPYLLYTYARARSILRKSKSVKKIKNISFLTESEKSIVLQLSMFPELVEQASSSLSPSMIANFAHSLSQKFNEFYHSTQVIDSENEGFRLALTSSFSQVLKNCLDLLNISTLEKM